MKAGALLVALLAALLIATTAGAGQTGTGHHWLRPTTAPAVVTVVDNLPSEWHGYVLQAAADYAAAANLDVVVSGPRQCVTDAALASPTWPGAPRAWLPGVLEHNNVCLDAHALAASGSYWGYTYLQPYNWTRENGSLLMGVEIWLDPSRIRSSAGWRQYIVCHELGHALGLAHRPSGDESCMVDGGGVPQPDADDLATIDRQTTVYVGKTCTKKKKRC